MIYTKAIIVIFLTTLNINCECTNTYGYSKVEWNEKNQIFSDTVINLGEKELSIQFESCNKKRKSIYLKGKVLSEDILYGNHDKLEENLFLLRCYQNGKIKDTIQVIGTDGYFDVKFEYSKKDFIVFKKTSNNSGYKIEMKGFKKSK